MILGGPHVSALPDEAMAHSDAVVVGEAEPLWPRVVADLYDDDVKWAARKDGARYVMRPSSPYADT